MNRPLRLDGAWQIVKAELAGEEMPAFVAEKIELDLNDGLYCVRFAGEISDRGTYVVDDTVSPRTLLLSGLEGANAGRTIPAIYQLAGDRLRVCYGLDGILPTAFAAAAAAAQKLYLVTYRRRAADDVARGS